jgi:hypothetical protein
VCISFWMFFKYVATLALGSQPRQGVARLWAKRKTWESHHMLLGVPKSVREWTLTLPSELPCWELWTPKPLEHDCKGQNPSFQGVLYIIKKILKRRCLKWDRIIHFDIWNTSYGKKKGRESNWQYDSRPLKVKNLPDFLVCRQRATYHWKTFDKGYNFAWDLIAIGGLHAKLCTPKVARVLGVRISGLPFGNPAQKAIWMWPQWRDMEYIIRGKVVASPKFGPWWLVCVRVARWLS